MAAEQKNDFSRGSVVKNILKLALPMTLAQLINVMYNIVDRLYIRSDSGERHPGLDGAGALPSHHFHCHRFCQSVRNGRGAPVFH